MAIDHTLDFGGFDDWIKVQYSFGYLDHFCCYGFAGCWGCRREEGFVELLKEFAEAFGTLSLVSGVVLTIRAVEILRRTV